MIAAVPPGPATGLEVETSSNLSVVRWAASVHSGVEQTTLVASAGATGSDSIGKPTVSIGVN